MHRIPCVNIPSTRARPQQRAGASRGLLRFGIILAAFFILAAAEYFFMSWTVLPRSPNGADATTWRKDFILSITGLETARVSNGQKIRLKVGRVMVAPRKFLVFSIQPLNEARFDDFSVDFFRRLHGQGIFPLSDLEQTLLPADGKGMLFAGLFHSDTGVITRGLIRRFKLTLYDGDEIKTVVRAMRAELDFKNDKIRLEDASVEQHEFKRIIRSNEAVLKGSDGTLSIHGKFSILHPAGVLRGSGLKISL